MEEIVLYSIIIIVAISMLFGSNLKDMCRGILMFYVALMYLVEQELIISFQVNSRDILAYTVYILYIPVFYFILSSLSKRRRENK